MNLTPALTEQIRLGLERVKADPAFSGSELWLTFYLCGPPERLRHVIAPLAQIKGQNLSGAEGGFLYPKVLVRSDATEILTVAEQVSAICETAGIELLEIDADTSRDATRSKFLPIFSQS